VAGTFRTRDAGKPPLVSTVFVRRDFRPLSRRERLFPRPLPPRYRRLDRTTATVPAVIQFVFLQTFTVRVFRLWRPRCVVRAR